MVRKLLRSLNWKRVTTGGWALALSQLGEVSAQTAEPPPTSGYTVTIILGLMATSLIVVLVGVWAVRGVRKVWVQSSASAGDGPGANGSSGSYCAQCGESMPAADRFCHMCGAKVVELTR